MSKVDETFVVLKYGKIGHTADWLSTLPEDFLLEYGYATDDQHWSRYTVNTLLWQPVEPEDLIAWDKKLIDDLLKYHEER